MPKPENILTKGGEMGELTRNYNWADSPLGPLHAWGVSLRVQVQMMLSSQFPMLIFWGPQLITFYNDAFRPSLGDNGKHPSSLGQPGEVSWAESWPTIGPMIYNIMAGGDAVWFEDQKLPLYRNGRMGYAYWTYSFSPITNDAGEVSGVLVTCSETTKAVEDREELAQTAERLDNLFTQISAGIAQTELSGKIIEANDRFCHMLGYSREELLTKTMADITHPEDVAPNTALLQQPAGKGEAFFINKRYKKKDGTIVWVNSSISFVTDPAGNKLITDVSIDNTTQQLQQLQIAESEARFQNLLRDVNVGLVVLTGKEMNVATVNEAYAKLIGHSVTETLHRPIFEVIPEAEATFRPILEHVLETGSPFYMNGATYSVHGADGKPINGYINVIYQPYREADGTITGVMAVVHDVTAQTLALQKIEASEARFRNLVAEAPVAIGLFRGRDLIIEMPNEAFIEVIGRGPDINNKPLAVVMPELEDQPFLRILDSVFESGETYRVNEAKLLIDKGGIAEERYFNITFSPLFENGAVTGILDISIDITEQVLARKKLEQSETALKGALELAELATWTIDLENDVVIYSHRLQEWMGIDRRVARHSPSPLVHERDRVRVSIALSKTTEHGGAAIFDEVYTIINGQTGQQRIIHSNGKADFNEHGIAISISGTSQDVTMQHELRLALENEGAITYRGTGFISRRIEGHQRGTGRIKPPFKSIEQRTGTICLCGQPRPAGTLA